MSKSYQSKQHNYHLNESSSYIPYLYFFNPNTFKYFLFFPLFPTPCQGKDPSYQGLGWLGVNKINQPVSEMKELRRGEANGQSLVPRVGSYEILGRQ